jgi:hypothetical protein
MSFDEPNDYVGDSLPELRSTTTRYVRDEDAQPSQQIETADVVDAAAVGGADDEEVEDDAAAVAAVIVVVVVWLPF